MIVTELLVNRRTYGLTFAFCLTAAVCVASHARSDTRVLVRGADLLEMLSGDSDAKSFASGYIRASLDSAHLCLPPESNDFSARDDIRKLFLALSNDELSEPASIRVVYPLINKWKCTKQEQPLTNNSLDAALSGFETSKSFGSGYISGTLDGYSFLLGCSLKQN